MDYDSTWYPKSSPGQICDKVWASRKPLGFKLPPLAAISSTFGKQILQETNKSKTHSAQQMKITRKGQREKENKGYFIKFGSEPLKIQLMSCSITASQRKHGPVKKCSIENNCLLHKFLSISSTKVKVNSNNDIAQKGSTLRSLVWLWTNSPLQRNVPGLSWPHFALWSNIRPNLWKKDSLTWSNVSPNVIKSGPLCINPRKDEYLTISICKAHMLSSGCNFDATKTNTGTQTQIQNNLGLYIQKNHPYTRVTQLHNCKYKHKIQ